MLLVLRIILISVKVSPISSSASLFSPQALQQMYGQLIMVNNGHVGNNTTWSTLIS